jgi:hypothetical protein
MSLKIYILSLILSTFLALGAWIFVLFNIDPFEAGVVGQVFFYTSLWLFILGIVVNILVWFRAKFLGSERAIETMGLSFRQGFFLALLFIILIILNANGYLVWWLGLLVTAGMFLVELYFLSRE